MEWTAAILAGGQSSRMGQDKALLCVAGETILARTIRLVLEAGATTVLVLGRSRPEDWIEDKTLFLPDPPEQSGGGPLVGLLTALEHSPTAVLALIACDMPALTVPALRWLVGSATLLSENLPDGVITENAEGEAEPLFSLYTTAVRSLVTERLQANRRSLKGLIEAGKFVSLPILSDFTNALINVNTPEELTAYLERTDFLR